MRKRLVAGLSLVALVIGFLTTQQIRTVSVISRTAQIQEGRTLSHLVAQADQNNVQTQARIAAITAHLASLVRVPNPGHVRELVQSVRPLADLTPVKGAGVMVVMHDGAGHLFPGEPPALQLVHDQYVLRVVTLLSGAGAQAVSINGQRYTATTSIYCAGPTIRINGVPYASPFVVRAVGPSQAMIKALKTDPDIEGWSQLVSIKFHSVRALEIPPYDGLLNFSLAKPVKIKG